MQRRRSLLHLSQAFTGMLQPHAMPGSNQALLSLKQWAQLHAACDMQAQSAWQGCHSFHSSPSLADFITLNNISDNPGAKHQVQDLPACFNDIELIRAACGEQVRRHKAACAHARPPCAHAGPEAGKGHWLKQGEDRRPGPQGPKGPDRSVTVPSGSAAELSLPAAPLNCDMSGLHPMTTLCMTCCSGRWPPAMQP